VTTAAVSKGEIVSVGVAVRVFWPLDDAWYGGHVTGYEKRAKNTSCCTTTGWRSVWISRRKKS
jgi:hypothetical protein